MKQGSAVTYLHTDHPSASLRTCLGSTSVASNASGVPRAHPASVRLHPRRRWFQRILAKTKTSPGKRLASNEHSLSGYVGVVAVVVGSETG